MLLTLAIEMTAIVTRVTQYLATAVIYIPLTVCGVEFFHISTDPFNIFFIGIAIWVLWPLLNCSICFLAIELVPYIFCTLASFQICFANTLSL